MKLSTRESLEYLRLKQWEEKMLNQGEPGVIKNLSDFVRSKLVKYTPEQVLQRGALIREAILTALEGCVDAQQSVAAWTFNKHEVVTKFRDRGICSLDDMYKIDAMEIKQYCSVKCSENKVITFAEGTVMGLGEWYVALADIPLFMTINFRAIQQVAACYGYDPDDELERLYVINVMSLAWAASTAGKVTAQYQMQALKAAVKRLTYKQLEEKGGIYAATVVIRELAKNLGYKITKDMIIKGVPVAGALFGGTFNVGFMSRNLRVAHSAYRKRFLEDKMNRN